jgi:hypothetical protein
MAYFIVLKYLRSLEEFKKNPHVKIPPKSPCANPQILGIFKNQILCRKEFFLTFGPTGPAASWPIRTFGPAAALFFPPTGYFPSPLFPTGPRPVKPATFFLLPHWSQSHKAPPPAGLTPPPQSTPTSPLEEKMAASIPLHSPINRCHFPSSITGNRRLQSGAIEAPSTPAIEGTRPPPPRLRPIKGRPALGEDSHTSNTPSLSSQRALAVAHLSRSSAAGEMPPHRLSSRGNPTIDLACPSFPSPTPRSELSGTRAAGGRAPVSSQAWQWPPVHGGPGWRDPRTCGLGPLVFL